MGLTFEALPFLPLFPLLPSVQLALDRSILGISTASSPEDPDPALVQISVRPFPWPETDEDLGAAAAAAFLNLLLVFAFLAPTREAVGAVVREKELRLREGMKILGETLRWPGWRL